ncbi:transcription factor MYC2-like [Panicum virgatum]|uniref:BHLH domain-containing protein n=1 Tax=Panicum virgatum TaxID=38727 RepID=A0A8T0VDX5_PANVG|nr:transcription factor MYC2-like [Panicum virgatum]KAG2630963.1 hypothetical protein PVAP13_3KG561900 [Panicum virgatum]KAG2630964.1 hypothetical protein PVAP13_3KG561900 [Panicum virgatum]
MDRHMEDSSTFLQWAMNQLHHQHPSAAAAAAAASAYHDGAGAGDREAIFPSLHALRRGAGQTQSSQQPVAASVRVRDLTVQVDHLTNSSSSGDSPGAGDAMDHDAAAGWSPHTARSRTTGLGGGGGGGNNWPVSWNFSAASAQPTRESGGGGALPDAAVAARVVQLASAGRRGSSSAAPPAATAAASSSPGPVQDHIIAERRRREKINQRFIELSTVIPGLKKMDKATILGDAVKYVRELQEKVKTLEEDGAHSAGGSSIQSAVLVKKPCHHLPGDEAMASSNGGGAGGVQLPEIEARLSEKSVLLRIHCYNARGLLVRVISEVEQMHLSITHTNVMPFPASTAIITITAKVEEGFTATVDEIVRSINSVLHQHYSSSSEEKEDTKVDYC